eukprot:3333346-Pyramimonas_sp.AAC.1
MEGAMASLAEQMGRLADQMERQCSLHTNPRSRLDSADGDGSAVANSKSCPKNLAHARREPHASTSSRSLKAGSSWR